MTDSPIELLVFLAGGMRFGVYAGQVTYIMPAEEFHILSENGVFSFVYRDERFQGLDFGSWMGQYTLSRCFLEEAEELLFSKRLLIAALECQYQAIMVDKVEQFLTISLSCLHTLPTLLRRICRFPALWGLAQHEGAMILLIDLFPITIPNSRS